MADKPDLTNSQWSIHDGDVVQLLSGGPRMTVTDTNGDEIHCLWFNGEIPMRDTFPRTCLGQAEPGSTR